MAWGRPGKILAVSLTVCLCGAGWFVAMGVPSPLAKLIEKTAQSCLDNPNRNRCKFLGTPLEMDGAPVFVGGFRQAFLPTKGKIEFVDAQGVSWVAPAKTLTDGATIPAYFEPLVGDRQSREYVLAAALHDAYCGIGNDKLPTWQARPWEDVHRMFYEALLVNGTSPTKAKIMFAAVYLGGPRWEDPTRELAAIPKPVLVQEFKWCKEWIEAENPTLPEIEEWMSGREAVLKSGLHSPPAYFTALPDNI